MGSDVTLPSFTKKTFTEQFEYACPYYMAMGMTYDEFWNDKPIKAKFYREMEKVKQEKMNEQLWLQGVYMTKAIEATVGNMLRGKKGTPIKYPNEPFPITAQESEKKREEQALREQQEISAKFMNMAHSINNTLKKKGG